MSSAPAAATPPQTVVVERAHLLLDTLPVSALTNATVAAIAVGLLGGGKPGQGLAVWGGLMLALQGLRLLLWLLWRHAGTEAMGAAAQRRRLAQLRAAAWATAAFWGVLSVALYPADALSQSILAFILAGISGAAVAGLAFDAWTSAVFICAVVLPLMLRLLFTGTAVSLAMGLLVCVYLAYLLAAVRRGQSQFLQLLDWRTRAEAASASARQQARQNAALATANQLGATASDVATFFAAVCAAAVEQTGVSAASVLQRAPSPATGLTVVAQAAAAPQQIAGAAAQLAWDADAAQFLLDDGCLLGVLPLHSQGEVVALLQASGRPPAGEDWALRDWLHSLAASLDRGLQGIWQRQRIARLQKLYRALMSEGEVVLQSRSAEDMVARTCERLTQEAQFHAAWLARPDAQGAFVVLARAGEGASQLDHFRVHLGDTNRSPLVLRVWDTARVQVCNDLLQAQTMEPWRRSLARYRWHAALAAPVRRGDRLWGVLVFTSAQAHDFDGQTIALCEQVAALLGYGLDELDAKERLSALQRAEAHRARHDTLTGLPNRYALEQHLPAVIARAKKLGSAFALCMIDLDGFKRINDTWGHSAGDRVLRELARRLQGVRRQHDYLARLGGDEFIVVMEDISPQEVQARFAHSVARLRQAVAAPFDVAPGVQLPMDMSLGVASYPVDAQDAQTLMRLADKAMYAVKSAKSAAHACGAPNG